MYSICIPYVSQVKALIMRAGHYHLHPADDGSAADVEPKSAMVGASPGSSVACGG
jgi:hypothetical protein